MRLSRRVNRSEMSCTLRATALILMVFCLASRFTFGAEPTTRTNHILTFASTTHDFGRVPQDRSLKCSFEFVNRSRHRIKLAKCIAECGCTSTNLRVLTMAPGETNRLAIEFWTGKYCGPVSKHVAVRILQPVRQTYMLTVVADVYRQFRVVPSQIDYGRVLVGEVTEKSVALMPGDTGDDLTGIRVVSSPPMVTTQIAKASPSVQRPAETLRIRCRLGPVNNSGTINEYLVLESPNPRLGTIRIPLKASIVRPIQLYPATVFLGRGQAGQLVKARIVAKNARGGPGIALEECRCPWLVSVESHETEHVGLAIDMVFRLPPIAGINKDQVVMRFRGTAECIMSAPLVANVSALANHVAPPTSQPFALLAAPATKPSPASTPVSKPGP